MRTRESDHDYESFIKRTTSSLKTFSTTSKKHALLQRRLELYHHEPGKIRLLLNKGGWINLHGDVDRVFNSTNGPFLGDLTGIG